MVDVAYTPFGRWFARWLRTLRTAVRVGMWVPTYVPEFFLHAPRRGCLHAVFETPRGRRKPASHVCSFVLYAWCMSAPTIWIVGCA